MESILSALPVLVVGDSNAMPYDNRVVVRDGLPPLVFRSFYIGGARIAKVGVTLDTFAPAPVEEALVAAQLVVDDGQVRTAVHRFSGPSERFETDIGQHWAIVNALAQRRPPWIFLTYGAFDMLDLMESLDGDDIELSPWAVQRWPTAEFRLEAPKPGAIPWQSIRHHVWWELRALRTLIIRFRASGFHRIAIAAIPPPHPDDGRFAAVARTLNVRVPPERRGRSYRYKVAITINEVLAALCADENAHFIDAWNSLTDNGLWRPELIHADDFHMADEGVRHSITVFADTAYAANARETAEPTGNDNVFAAGDWVVHDAIAGAAMVTRPADAGASVIVERPAYGLPDRWETRRIRAATPDEIAAARGR